MLNGRRTALQRSRKPNSASTRNQSAAGKYLSTPFPGYYRVPVVSPAANHVFPAGVRLPAIPSPTSGIFKTRPWYRLYKFMSRSRSGTVRSGRLKAATTSSTITIDLPLNPDLADFARADSEAGAFDSMSEYMCQLIRQPRQVRTAKDLAMLEKAIAGAPAGVPSDSALRQVYRVAKKSLKMNGVFDARQSRPARSAALFPLPACDSPRFVPAG